MLRRKIVSIVISVLLLVGVFVAGVYVGQERIPYIERVSSVINKETPDTRSAVDFEPFWKAWNVIDEKFVGVGDSATTTSENFVYGAIEGLVSSLNDPYSVFLRPEEAEQFGEDIRGKFGGVGMEVGVRDGTLTVIAPLKDTPAERAGVRAGDQIIRIDGEVAADLSIDEAIGKIRGEVGTAVVLTLARQGESEVFDVSIVRGTIKIPTIETETLPDDGVFVIRLFNFNANASSEFRKALEKFVKSGTRDLVVDLRGNPGGFLNAAIDIASWFVPKGEPIVREVFDGTGREEEVHRSNGSRIDGPEIGIVVLVDGGSASASEIVAGALHDHGVATLVGATTFGKGSVQELVDITDTAQLKITVAQWLTPDGTSISDGGLAPDIEVDITPEDIENDLDPQLDRAIEVLKQSR